MFLSRRRRSTTSIAAAAAAVVLVAGCGADTADADDPEPGDHTAAEGTTDYPLTLSTPYGESVLEERPERVAVVGGLQDLEATLALGVVPILAHEPAQWPWNRDNGADQVETTIDIWAEDGLPFEDILATEPDVILAVSYGELEQDFTRLTSIAPVVGLEHDDFPTWQVSWEETTRLIGAALDLNTAAEDLIADVDGQVADFAAAHPEYQGRTISMIVNRGEEIGVQLVNTAGSPVEELATDLGFAPHPHAETVAATDGDISTEQLEMLDADLMLVGQHGGTGSPEEGQQWLESNQLYQSLSVVERDAVAVIQPDPDGTLPLAWAFSYPNALSIPWTLGVLEEALDGVVTE